MTSRRRAIVGVLLAVALAGTACGGDGGNASPGVEGESLTVYSGRKEDFVGPLLTEFQKETGIKPDVRYADSAELAATILEEGQSSPADVFLSQDAGALGAVGARGLFAPLPEDIIERIDERFRSPEGLWVGTSGRARVAAYNTDVLAAADLPASIVDFTREEWKGRIGFPPTNSSFQAFVAAMIQTEGQDETRAFLEGLTANDPALYEDNSSTVRAIASGEIDVGFVNHYYLYEVAAEDGGIPVANHFFSDGDPGALINSAGVGILGTSQKQEAARRLVEYLTGDAGQRYFAEETFEYPVAEGYEPRADLPALTGLESPEIDLSDLEETIDPALRLLAEVGLL